MRTNGCTALPGEVLRKLKAAGRQRRARWTGVLPHDEHLDELMVFLCT